MKIAISRPKLHSVATKSVLVVMSLVIAVASPIQMTQTVAADQFDDRINALMQDLNNYNAQAAILAAQASTLQSEVASLQSQAAVIQAQVDISQAEYDKLVAQIAETEQKINDNQDALGATIANMYVDGNVTPIEMLASSSSISDYMDKQEYQSSIRNQLTATIATIKDLKTQLDKKKTDQGAVLDKQKAEKANLVALQNQQQDLLNQTQGQEATYQQLVANNKQKLTDVAAQQQAYYQNLLKSGGGGAGVVGSFQYNNWSGNQGCSGGYVYCGAQDSYSDPWGLYNRECVSYVAWALVNRFNKYVGNFSGQGNAYEWPDSAVAYSGATRVYNPQIGDAIVLPIMGNFSPLGHLMIVESVNGDWMHVSQYNFYGTGEYSTMDIKNSGIVILRFHDK